MEHLNIPLFPGQGTTAVNSQRVQDQAIISSSSPAGTLLLSSCFEAFHSELSSLSETELEMTGVSLADFDRPMSLLFIPQSNYLRNPVISGTRLHVLQALIYLEWATRSIGSASDTLAALLQQNSRHGAGIIGFSSGVISACVVGTSATLLDFLCNAVSAFRIALWIGVRTQFYRRRTLVASGFRGNDDRSWSRVLLGIGRHAAEEAISQFVQQNGESAPLYVTAVNDEQCITVSGRPDILDSFIATLPRMISVRETSVGTMYHSPSHNGCVREEVLADLWRRKIRFPTFASIICPIRSTFTGETLEANQKGSLVQFIVDMILIHPVNWDKVMNAVAQSIPENEIAHLINVGPGTGLIRSIEKAFRRGGSVLHYLDFDDTKEAIPEPAQDCIAIVGMAVKLPGAPTLSKLWDILEQGINTLAEVPKNRFRVSDYTTGQYGRSMRAHSGNFLDDVDKFDHEFFNISPREARSMDPQMRILLQTAYEALEDSGYVPNTSRSFNPETIGCYVGAATGDYVQNLRHNIDVYYSTGTLRSFLSGRISHAMGFGGPSVVVDTACSSSLVAIHQACRALLNGDCSAALAGGVNVITSPDMFLGLDRGHFLSPTGPCKVFDASADGYSRGEGCGLFVLKRFSDARAENDRILAVIRGVEVNQSGAARSITQPHVPTQVKLFKQLLEKSGVAPEDVNVVEAHGTGTQSGDVGELESVRRVFAVRRSAENPLHITSIKANIGHLEAASGAAGLAKLLLMLRHRTIPRLVSLINLNPRISELVADHTMIDTENRPWNPAREGLPRMALLNNFGAAGSNCALLLQEFVTPDIPRESPPSSIPYIFGLSAKTEVALFNMRSRFIDWLNSADARNTPLSDIAYSLTARRQIYEHRISLTARTKQELVEGLLSSPSPVRVSRQDGKVAFVFSGQGEQYLGMGSGLYRSVPLFQGIIDQCHTLLVKSGFVGVVPVIAPEKDSSTLSDIEWLEAYQSAIFALEYGLAQLWISWGVTPALVVGHSLGEYVAQTVAGVLTLQDALLLVASRARLMVQKCLPDSTGMMAINLSAVAIGQVLASSEEFSAITVACYNSPEDHVVSGPVAGLQALKSYLDGAVRCKNILLPVGFGHHSDSMRPLHDELTSLARRITTSPPTIPIISNVYGVVVLPGDASVFDPQYYSLHCTEPVLFDDGIRAIVATHALPIIDVWIEIGPHATILPTLKRNPVIQDGVLFLASMRKRQHPLASLYNALAQLFVSPFEIKWRSVFSHLSPPSNISLPTYPWSNTSFWVSFEERAAPAYRIPSELGPKTGSLELPYTVLYTWIQFPSLKNGFMSVYETPIVHLSKLIRGHCVREQHLCPASVYHELALAGVEASILFLQSSLDNSFVVLHDVDFSSPLVYTDDACYAIQTSTIFETENAGSWKVVSTTQGEKKTHAHGGFQLRLTSGTIQKFSTIYPVISSRVASIISKRNCKIFTTSSIYEVLFPRVVIYGKNYHAIQTLTISADSTEGYATISLPDDSEGDRFVVHPILMDAMLHVAGFIANIHGGVNDAFICSKVGCVEVISRFIDDRAPYGVYVNCAWLTRGDMLAESYALEQGPTNRIVARLEGVLFRKVPLATLERGLILAATGPILPESSGLKGTIASSGSPLRPPFSQHFSEVQSAAMKSPSGALLASLPSTKVSENQFDSFRGAGTDVLFLSRCGIKTDTIGVTVEGSRARGSEVSFRNSGPANWFQIRDDNTSQPPDVKALLAAVLGLKENELHEDADLESLGLDSLASIEAHHALQSHFALVLPSDLFTAHISAKAVQSFIASLLLASSKSLYMDADSCSTDTAYLVIDRSEPTSPRHTVPTPVQRTGPGRVPLFLVHDGSGLIKYMYNLSPLGRDLWGIHNPHFMDSKPWGSVESMATEYAKCTTKAAGPGPVLLGGWSFGGIIAFEVARQLLKSGVVVKGVVLIDSPSPRNHVPLSDTLIESIVKLDRNPVPSNIGVLVKQQFQMNSRMLIEYDPTVGGGPYPQLVLLCSCENYCPSGGLEIPDWLSNRDNRRSAGWETIVGVPVKCIEIPGHHFQPFHSPYISSTSSAIIEACSLLEAAEC